MHCMMDDYLLGKEEARVMTQMGKEDENCLLNL